MFMDFRIGLILSGQKAFESILREPDSLADYDIPCVESFFDLINDVYSKRHDGADLPTSESMDDDDDDENEANFDEEDGEWFAKNFPRLIAKRNFDTSNLRKEHQNTKVTEWVRPPVHPDIANFRPKPRPLEAGSRVEITIPHGSKGTGLDEAKRLQETLIDEIKKNDFEPYSVEILPGVNESTIVVKTLVPTSILKIMREFFGGEIPQRRTKLRLF